MYWDPVWHIVEQVWFAAHTGPQVHPFYCKQSKQKAIKNLVTRSHLHVPGITEGSESVFKAHSAGYPLKRGELKV